MEFKNYYGVLGVERSATDDEIKRAYRKLARKFHPDVSKEKDAEVRFKELGEAYKVLKVPETRAAYDKMGSQWQPGQDFQPPPDWDAGFEFSGRDANTGNGAEFSEFFESLFGRQAGRSQTHQQGMHAQGQDHHAKVLIALQDAYHVVRSAVSLCKCRCLMPRGA
jgi:curved DNA-binding protein